MSRDLRTLSRPHDTPLETDRKREKLPRRFRTSTGYTKGYCVGAS